MKKMFLVLALLCLALGLANPVFGSPALFNTWYPTSTNLPGDDVNSIAFSPNYAINNTVFAASSNVFKSTDGGLTWGPTQLKKAANSLAFSSDNVLMAATSSGVYATLDGGVIWNPIHTICPQPGIPRLWPFHPTMPLIIPSLPGPPLTDCIRLLGIAAF